MSQRTELRVALSLLLGVSVVGGYLVLKGSDWPVGVMALCWLAFMLWAARFRCRGCRSHHLFDVGQLSVHPVWPRLSCRVCGLAIDQVVGVRPDHKP
jgi:hypothetical protein